MLQGVVPRRTSARGDGHGAWFGVGYDPGARVLVLRGEGVIRTGASNRDRVTFSEQPEPGYFQRATESRSNANRVTSRTEQPEPGHFIAVTPQQHAIGEPEQPEPRCFIAVAQATPETVPAADDGTRLTVAFESLRRHTLRCGVGILAHPRRIVPGETYLITRRCSQRTFRLRPSPETNRIFSYCLAVALEKTGVLLHAVCVMSNHHHLVVTDPHGVLPIFLREFHRLVAKAMNAAQGQCENLWAAESCNVVRLVTDADVEDKMAYVAANPVTAGLVDDPRAWPGLVAWTETSIAVERPARYFREKGTCPPDAMLRIVRPAARGACTPEERDAQLGRAIGANVAEARRVLRLTGTSFLGPSRVLAASFRRRARSYEKRFGLIPTFAALARDIRDRLRRVEKYFRRQHRSSLNAWSAGDRCVEFPFGTWWMRVAHAAVIMGTDPS